jgi:hypothetical protein
MSSMKKKYVTPKLNEWKKVTETFQSIDFNLSQDVQQQVKKEVIISQKII